MTDPRIEAAARELKRLFSEGETSPNSMWLSCAKCVLDAADAAAWRPMANAPRDRTEILAKTRPDVFPETHNRSCWNGRSVVIRHEGIVNDDFDMGWSVAAPVGYGGMPDDWFVGWQPLPAPPASIAELGGVDG